MVSSTELIPIGFHYLNERLHFFFVVLPFGHRGFIDRLADLREACRTHGAFGFMEFHAAGLPVQAHELNQLPGIGFRIFDDLFAGKIEPVHAFNTRPVIGAPQIIGETPGNGLAVVGPADGAETGLVAERFTESTLFCGRRRGTALFKFENAWIVVPAKYHSLVLQMDL